MTFRDRIAEPWGVRTPYESGGIWPTRVDTYLADGVSEEQIDRWVQSASLLHSNRDALDIGDVVDVSSARGTIRAQVRISGIRDGVLFVPFHYGYWDVSDADGHHRVANELTITDWDPVSKQPIFKTAAARMSRVGAGDGNAAPAPTNTASRPVSANVPATYGGPAAHADEQTSGGGQ